MNRDELIQEAAQFAYSGERKNNLIPEDMADFAIQYAAAHEKRVRAEIAAQLREMTMEHRSCVHVEHQTEIAFPAATWWTFLQELEQARGEK